jgi:two-component system, NarL family, response regulator LiaR
MDKKIRILLIEDELLVAEAICALLELETGFTVVAEAATASEGIRKAQLVKPDVILLDLRLPDQPGVQIIPELLECVPQSYIIVMTAYADDQEVATAFKLGAVGCVMKTQAIAQLVEAIRAAARGQTVLTPAIAQLLLRQLHHTAPQSRHDPALSESEKQVLTFVAHAYSNKEIAKRLNLSDGTVRTHVSHILDKLHLENRTQAALYALRQGFTKLEMVSIPTG